MGGRYVEVVTMVKARSKKKSLAEVEEIARKLTVESLRKYSIPEKVRSKLVLGTFFDKDDRIFELYIPGDRPEDARVISRVRISTITGEGSIEVFLDRDPEVSELDD